MEKHLCPVCRKHEFDSRGSFDYCPWCGWGDDSWDDIDDEWSGFNGDTIGGYRKKYEAGKTESPELISYRKTVLRQK